MKLTKFKNICYSVGLVGVLFLSGCYSVPEKVKLITYNKPVFNKTLTVLPVEEMRKKRNDNYGALGIVPLIPYVTITRDASNVTSLNLINKEIIVKLVESNLFTKVDESYSNNNVDGDYILEGDLISTKFDTSTVTYGLSLAAFPFWILGVPGATHYYYLIINFRLIDNKTGEQMWDKQFSVNKGFWLSMYAPESYRDGLRGQALQEYYDYLVSTMMNKVIVDIKQTLKNK